MDYLTTKEAAFRWNTTEQMIRRHCREGRIPGAIQRDGSGRGFKGFSFDNFAGVHLSFIQGHRLGSGLG